MAKIVLKMYMMFGVFKAMHAIVQIVVMCHPSTIVLEVYIYNVLFFKVRNMIIQVFDKVFKVQHWLNILL